MDFQSFAENLRNSAQEDAANLLLDFSKDDPETLLEYAERLTDDQHSDLLKMLQGSAYHALSATAWNADEKDKALDFIEKALVSCMGIDPPAVHEKLDSWALALGAMRPGRPQEILKRTKLKYLGNRIYPFNDNFSLSEEGLAPFANIWLSPSKIVKSAVIFSKILGQGSGRQLCFLLYDMENPWNEIGGGMAQWKTDYLDIVTITLDGTVSFESQKSSAMQKEQKIISSAKKEIEYKEQQELFFAKAEVERREQIRIRDEEHREQLLKEKERRTQIRREREKFWQDWFSRNKKIITISGFSIILIASIATFLWFRNLKIKEEQIRLARETAENLAQKFVKENIITCNGFSYIKINNIFAKLNQDIQVAIHEADENFNFASFEVWSSGDDFQYEGDKGWVKNDLLLFGMIQKYGQWIQKDIKKISCSDIREITVSKNPPLPNTLPSSPSNQNLNDSVHQNLANTAIAHTSENSYKSLSENKNPWIFVDSDKRYLTDNEIKNLSTDDLWKARNEIYAKKGYIFNTDRGRQYAQSLDSFYYGIETDVKKIYRQLNTYEKYNVKLIQKYEK